MLNRCCELQLGTLDIPAKKSNMTKVRKNQKG